MFEDKIWWCYHCWQNSIESWDSMIGAKWVCKCCGAFGNMADPDAPKFITEEERDHLEEDYRKQFENT